MNAERDAAWDDRRAAAQRALAELASTFADSAQQVAAPAAVWVGHVGIDAWLDAQDEAFGSLADLLDDASRPPSSPLVTFRTALPLRRAITWSLHAVQIDAQGFILLEPNRHDEAEPALLAGWAPWEDDEALGLALRHAWREHMDRIFVAQQTRAEGRVTHAMLEQALFAALEAHPAYWSAVREYAFPLTAPEQRALVLQQLLQQP